MTRARSTSASTFPASSGWVRPRRSPTSSRSWRATTRRTAPVASSSWTAASPRRRASWEADVRIAYSDDQIALRDELRTYFAKLVTPEVASEAAQGEMGGPRSIEAIRQMGHDGWLGVGWPKEYGGRGFGPM